LSSHKSDIQYRSCAVVSSGRTPYLPILVGHGIKSRDLVDILPQQLLVVKITRKGAASRRLMPLVASRCGVQKVWEVFLPIRVD